MRIIKSFLMLAVCLFTVSAFAQNMEQGSITMELTEINSDNEQMAAQLEMLKGTQTQYYFNKDKSLMKADMMGGMIKMTTLINNDDEHLTFLMDAMGNKIMVESEKAERKEMEAKQKEAMEGVRIVYDENSTKEIMGHKVIKATLESDEEMPMTFTLWVAPGIQASNKLVQGMEAFELKGFPLQYEMQMENMSMVYTTIDIQTKVDPSVFEINTAGYQKMTFEEFQSQMGQMGGMGGF